MIWNTLHILGWLIGLIGLIRYDTVDIVDIVYNTICCSVEYVGYNIRIITNIENSIKKSKYNISNFFDM